MIEVSEFINRRLSRVGFVLLAMSLAGCASNGHRELITSFDDLTSASEREGVSDVTQNRIVSMAGSLPQAITGAVYRYKSARAASTAFGLTPGTTYLQVKTIPAPKDAADTMRNVASKLRAVQMGASQVAQDTIAERTLSRPRGDGEDSVSSSSLQSAMKAKNDSRRKFDLAVTDARDVINKSGLMVVRWDVRAEDSRGFASQLFSVEGESSSVISGFAIFAGLRETTLNAGRDLDDLLDSLHLEYRLQPHWTWRVWDWYCPDRHTRITTRTVQARQIAFVQDSDSRSKLGVRLDAEIEELTGVARDLAELGRIEVDLMFERAASLSNEAFLANAEWSTHRVNYGDGQGCEEGGHPQDGEVGKPTAAHTIRCLMKSLNNDTDPDRNDSDGGGWQTLYAVDSDLGSLVDLFDDCD
ncbi:MAG: hypothetical protein ACI9EF_003339 [Pseudohongiellaceae bacterium]